MQSVNNVSKDLCRILGMMPFMAIKGLPQTTNWVEWFIKAIIGKLKNIYLEHYYDWHIYVQSLMQITQKLSHSI